jgi:hypothetical protein
MSTDFVNGVKLEQFDVSSHSLLFILKMKLSLKLAMMVKNNVYYVIGHKEYETMLKVE